ncbi:hypothetical protein HO133_001620 [Letharia lupina]|uniref:DUF4219 domain-containing protein n=1 Tax=Letharia lupina TaxID=560253 RepID=A0A8H6CDV7_9LECA|nr:uncharacterized protein HO133_001620 [Letharia lupina]KAF6221652.1 hypothetical protein HO133_001620 [Letharia lupina]
MDPETSSFKSPIRQLTDNNYSEWLIDVKALLRGKKLWNYTQEAPDPDKSVTAQAKWRDSAMEAADLITPTISGPVKQKLQANAFDDGYLMMTSLVNIYAPKGDAEFMRLTREYYSLRYEDFDSMTHYLTQIKTLEERIRGTNVILDDDKQTLLCLGMTLPERFQYFTKIWAVTLGMTADKARSMLLEEERREKTLDTGGVGLVATTRHPGKRMPSGKAILNYEHEVKCSRCGKPHEDEVCWKLHPELAPEWLQERWTIEKRSRKRKWDELQQDQEASGEKEAFINL